MKKVLLAAAAVVALPAIAQAQQDVYAPGVYFGVEGGLNWLFNTTILGVNNSPLTGWAAGGKIGYNFSPNLRFNIDGRYYGTTNPQVAGSGWSNNNASLIASVQVKFGAAPPPPPPPPPAVAPPSFMVFFDWDRSNLSQQALVTIKQASDAFKAKG